MQKKSAIKILLYFTEGCEHVEQQVEGSEGRVSIQTYFPAVGRTLTTSVYA